MSYLIIFAFVLSLDAVLTYLFVSSIYDLSNKKRFYASVITGLFHMILPLISYFILSKIIGDELLILNVLNALFFLYMAIQLGSTDQDDIKSIDYKTLTILSFFVSIDSFFSGITIINANESIITAVILFFLFTSTLTYLSLRLGKKISKKLPIVIRVLGISIYLLLAIKSFF